MGLNAVACWTGTGGGTALLVAVSVPAPGPGRAAPEAAVDAFASKLAVLARAQAPANGAVAVAAGAIAENVGSLAASLQEALEVLAAVPHQSGPAVVEPAVHRSANRALRGLMGALRADPRLANYVERSLGAILDQDARRGTDLLAVLRAYLAHPGNRTKAAANSHLSRSVFYQRLDTIEELLGVDLASGEVIAELQTAVIAWESSQGPALR